VSAGVDTIRANLITGRQGPMHVDGDELRAAAKALRGAVEDHMYEAGEHLGRAKAPAQIGAGFDCYTPAGAYTAAIEAWHLQFGKVTHALRQLSDALDDAAAAYDRSDAAASARMTRVPR
jgi:hypothetical protein